MEDINKNLEKKYYFQSRYIDKDRFVSYYWQNYLIHTLGDIKKILEIGSGNKIIFDILQKQGFEISVLDINKNLDPNFVGSVENMDMISDEEFDAVLCCEVLEHLSFEKFEKSLQEIRRVTKKFAVVSLPYWGYTFGFRIRLPYIGKKTLQFKLSGFKKHTFNGQHYWEIGKYGYTLKSIKKIIQKSGFEIQKAFWDIDDPYHYYLVLEKR